VDGGAIADRLPRGSDSWRRAFRYHIGARDSPRASSRFPLSPAVSFSPSPFRFQANASRMHHSTFPLRLTFPHISFEYQLSALSTFRRLVSCAPDLTSISSPGALFAIRLPGVAPDARPNVSPSSRTNHIGRHRNDPREECAPPSALDSEQPGIPDELRMRPERRGFDSGSRNYAPHRLSALGFHTVDLPS
jgi:hypothetical protein